MRNRPLTIGFCCAWLVACGGGSGGDLSFQDMCDQGAAAMCAKAKSCGSTQPAADCIAQGKAQNCAGGVEQYCGVGMTFQAGKATACLDALDALACDALDTIPSACTPEALCLSSSGSTPGTAQAEACHAPSSAGACDASASVCFAAGTSSSCTDRALCLGDGTGMTCAAACKVDADCSSAGTGLLCLQGCALSIFNGYCVTPKAKAKLMQYECADPTYANAPGTSGWIL